MCHIFFVHSSVEGDLGCFQVLAMMNNAAMNIAEQISLWNYCEFFGYIPKRGIAGSWGRLIPNFLRNLHIDSKVSVQVYIPTDSGRVFPLFHILSSISCHSWFWSQSCWHVLFLKWSVLFLEAWLFQSPVVALILVFFSPKQNTRRNVKCCSTALWLLKLLPETTHP